MNPKEELKLLLDDKVLMPKMYSSMQVKGILKAHLEMMNKELKGALHHDEFKPFEGKYRGGEMKEGRKVKF